MSPICEFTAERMDGTSQAFSDDQGQVLLIVNTASKCGFTPQFEGLEALYQQYKEQGLVVIGFPCNQFGSQDPGSNDEIGAFCQKNYGVSFPMMSMAMRLIHSLNGLKVKRAVCSPMVLNGISPSF